MKAFLLGLVSVTIFAVSSFADTYVGGYHRANGTYVKPHYRSSPNNTTSDNWSTKGNVNPYTGREGTRNSYDYNSGSNYNSNSYGNSNSWDND